MQQNQAFPRVRRWKAALRLLGAAALFAVGLQLTAPRADAAEPHLFHRLCDPRAPAEDLEQAAHCTTIDATIAPDPDYHDTDGDRIWMRMSDACEIELKSGSKAIYKGDGSEKNYEFSGTTPLPVNVKWTFPSGCSLQAHVRQPQGTLSVFPITINAKDLVRYFEIDGSRVTGDTVRLTLSVDDGSVSPTR